MKAALPGPNMHPKQDAMLDCTRPAAWTPFPAYLPDALNETSRQIHLAKGELLFHTGDSVADFFFVHAGELAAVRCLPKGAEAIMLTARPGEFFGEASLFQPNYSCEARALSACVLSAFNAAQFRHAMQADPGFAMAFVRMLAVSLRRQCSRVERLRLKNATDRVLHYLACETGPSGWAEIGGTVQEWAAELALEPETLYRTLAQLEKEGVLAREQRRFRLLGASVMACGTFAAKT